MTSRQAGKRISALSRRGPGAGGAGKRKKSTLSPREKRGLTRLVICGTIFVLMVGVKLLLPGKLDGAGAALSAALARNMDVSEVFSAVGRGLSGEAEVQDALRDVYQAVFHPSQALETSAAASRVETTPLRDFAAGGGSASGWLPETAASGGEEPPAEEEGAESGPAAAEQAEQAQTSEQEQMALSYILYSGENLPENVTMEQAVLGFDYCTPVKGTLTSPFGYREHPVEGEERFHYGLDLAADTGTEIDCFADGTVTAVGESSSYGKYLTVAHDSGFTTLYAHCSAVTVSSGAAVAKGQKIAEVGETGLATGPHLHFELHREGVYLNPIYYVSLA